MGNSGLGSRWYLMLIAVVCATQGLLSGLLFSGTSMRSPWFWLFTFTYAVAGGVAIRILGKWIDKRRCAAWRSSRG